MCTWGSSLTETRERRFPGPGITGSCDMPTWVLGTEFRSSARTVYALTCWVISPAPWTYYFCNSSKREFYLLKVSSILQSVNSVHIARSRSLEFSYFRWIKLWPSNNSSPKSSWWICFDFLFPLWREASRWTFTPHGAMLTWGNRLCWMTDTFLPALSRDAGCCSSRKALFPFALIW